MQKTMNMSLGKFYILIIIVFGCTLDAKEYLYTHFPSNYPSKNVQTKAGKELTTLINNSKSEIVFAIYGLRDQNEILEALLKAKKRGVDIKGVVDSDAHGANYYSDTHLLFNYFPIATDKKSHIMHNKFFVIDRKIVWSGSSNISDTGTGGYNANLVAVIEDEKIAQLYYDEFNDMFHQNFSQNKSIRYLENIQTRDSEIGIYFSPKIDPIERKIIALIQHAKKSIDIPIFYLTHKKLSNELILAKKRGVDVRIILDASAADNQYSTHKELRNNGVLVKVENFGGKMHCKSMVIDEEYLIVGSMNFTKAGVEKNDENVMIIKNKLLAKEGKEYFEKLWNTIPNKYLKYDPKPESFESKNSCNDGIDNDFDGNVDGNDSDCK